MLAIFIAVAAALMMLAVPIVTSVDSDASLKEDKAGYSIKMVNPTDAEIATYDQSCEDKSDEVYDASNIFIGIFNVDLFETTSLTTSSYKVNIADGTKVNSGSVDFIEDNELFVENLIWKATAVENGTIIDPEFQNPFFNYSKAISAIKSYFGTNISIGDKVTITGKINVRTAVNLSNYYGEVDSTHSVIYEYCNTAYYIADIDVTIGLIKAGEDVGKTISFRSDSSFSIFLKVTYDYKGVAYKDLTSTSPCTITYKASIMNFAKGSSYYTVNGTDYSIDFIGTKEKTEDTYANIVSNTATDLDNYKAMIAAIPASTANVTVAKTYEDAQSLYNSVVIGVAGEEVASFILILVGIFVAIILIIVAILVVIYFIRKKKRETQ